VRESERESERERVCVCVCAEDYLLGTKDMAFKGYDDLDRCV
jgi:hypothetical protein